MRTPEEMAILIHREMGQGSLHVNTWDNQLAALLTAWRDECVEEARKPEAPASEDDYVTSPEWPFDCLVRLWGLPYQVIDNSRDRAMRILAEWRSALLTRAPRAESEYETDVRHNIAELKARTEAAEAERDRLKAEMRFIEESMRPMAKINAELEAERDDLRDRVEGMTQTMLDMLDRMTKDEAERDRLREENEALRSLVDGAEDVVELWGHATIHNGQREWAKGWLEKARVKGGES